MRRQVPTSAVKRMFSCTLLVMGFAWAPSCIAWIGGSIARFRACSPVGNADARTASASQAHGTRSPVLTPGGPPSRFDSASVGGLWLQQQEDASGSTSKLWYHGRSLEADPQVVRLSMGCIGVAASSDGITWERMDGLEKGDAVFAPSVESEAFDAALVGMGSIVGDRLYYFGGDREPFPMGKASFTGVRQSVGVAFWQEGEWRGRRHVFDPGPPGSWDEVFVASPQVVQHGPKDWRLYYHGVGREDRRFRIGLATSEDGLEWTRRGVILSPGEDGTWDAGGCSRRHVFPRPDGSGGYAMLYEATSAENQHGFGLAYSHDGLEWEKDADAAPVFRPSDDADAWDGKAVSSPHFVQESQLLYYVGINSSGGAAIGIAKAHDETLKGFSRV